MEQLQNLAAQLQKVRAAAIARAGEAHRDRSLDPAPGRCVMMKVRSQRGREWAATGHRPA